jgi:8-oxo-dGTP pyrophosphatase MutT (NUDIX family)
MQAFELLSSDVLLEGRAFKIRRDHVRTPDGRRTSFEIVEHGGSVIMVPIDREGNLLFVRQYRHAARASLLELPAGTREGEELYEVCAARELREETGMAAGRLERIGEYYLAPGYSTELMVVFVAQELVPDPLPADTDEFLEVVRVPVEDAVQMVARGQLPDAKSLAAMYIAQPSLAPYL